MKAVFDTNILIDYLRGIKSAKHELSLFREKSISLITWMEVLSGSKSSGEETIIRGLLETFSVISITQKIAERAVQIRRESRIRLPDAIIWASSLELGYILITRNTRDFPEKHPSIRVPYTF